MWLELGDANASATDAPTSNNPSIVAKSSSLREAVSAFNQKQYERSVAILMPLAEQGNPKAQYRLGIHYYLGLGVNQDDEFAVQWLARAAIQGDPEAQVDLGDMYFHGNGVAQDYKKAADLYRKAALQDYPAGQFNLGNMYYRRKRGRYPFLLLEEEKGTLPFSPTKLEKSQNAQNATQQHSAVLRRLH